MRKIIDVTPTKIIDAKTKKAKIVHQATPASLKTLKSKKINERETELQSLLDQYDYQLPNSISKMRQYVIHKLFKFAEEAEPNLSLKALEILGRVTEIGLFTTKIEIAVTDRPTAELESDLTNLLKNYSQNKEEVREITDEELRGYSEEPAIDDDVYEEVYEDNYNISEDGAIVEFGDFEEFKR
jgi:hypothetical protein